MSTTQGSHKNNLHLAHSQRWLLIRHSQKLTEDRCTHWLYANGIAFDECTPIMGDTIPAITDYSHLVVFGGVPQVHSFKKPQWMLNEMVLIESALARNIPCLGICLGAQLLAHVLGANIFTHPKRLREVGYQWIHPTNASNQFLNQSSRFLQWHSAGFELPAECEHLARSSLFEYQAFRHSSNSYGLQFHPEVTSDLLRHWQLRHRTAKAAWLGPVDRCRHRIDSFRFNSTVTNWFSDFLYQWAYEKQSEQLVTP